MWSAVHSLMLNPLALCAFHREDVKNFKKTKSFESLPEIIKALCIKYSECKQF